MLLTHLIRTALDLALLSAGNNNAAKMAMIAITTSSSIKVKPPRIPLQWGSGSVTAIGKVGAGSERESVSSFVRQKICFERAATFSLPLLLTKGGEGRGEEALFINF